MGGQAHPAPFPSGARPPAQTLPLPKCPAFPCSLRSPPSSLPGRCDPPPGLLNQFLEAEGQKVERKRKGGKPRWPRHRTQNGGGQTSRERGEMLGDPHSRPQSRPLAFTRASPPPGRPPSLKWEIAWEAQSGRLRATTSTLPPHPTPSHLSFVLLPTPLSKPPAQPTPFYFRYPVGRQ